MVTLDDIESLAQIFVVPVRMIGVEAHSLLEPLNAFLGPSGESQNQSHMGGAVGIVRVEGNAAFVVVECLAEVPPVELDPAEDHVASAFFLVELERVLGELISALVQRIQADFPEPPVNVGRCKMRVGQRVLRVELDCLLEEGGGLCVVLLRQPVELIQALQQVIVGRQDLRRLAFRALQNVGFDAPDQGGDNGPRDLVLDREDVLHVAVIALRPEMGPGLRVDQLDGYAHTVHRAPDTALHNVLDAQIAADLADVDRLVLECEGRVPGDHEERLEARQLRNQVVGDAVREVVPLRTAAHVDEGQERDRGLRRETARRAAALGTGRRRRRIQGHAIDADRLQDVLDLVLAEAFEPEIQPVSHALEGRRGQADVARLYELFDPKGDVDVVAVDVVGLDDDLADIDPDPVIQARILVLRVPPAGLLGLDVDGALDGIDDTREFDQETVACLLDQPAAETTDSRLEQLAVIPLEVIVAGEFVLHDMAGIAGRIGNKDRSEPADNVVSCHEPDPAK